MNPTPTPTPPPAELIQNAVRVIDTYQNLGPLMAVLGVATLALLFALAIAWIYRNSNSTVASALSKVAEDRATEAKEANRERREELEKIGNSVEIIATAFEKQTAIIERMDKRSEERAATEASQAASLDTLVNHGSKPLRELIASMASLMAFVENINTRTANMESLVAEIPAFRSSINSKLDSLLTEVSKQSTKPLPPIEPPPTLPMATEAST